METSINERLKVIKNKTGLSFNSIIKNKSIMILLIFFPFMSLVVPMIFIPFWACAAFVVQVNVIATTGLIYGTIVFGYKRTTLDSNEKLLTKSRSASYLSALIVITVFMFISSGIQLILMFTFNSMHLLIPNGLLSANEGDRGYDLTNLRYLGGYGSIFGTMIISFAIFFALRNLIKDQKNHYILVLAIMIVAFVGGGSLNDYFTAMTHVASSDNYERKILHPLFPIELYGPTVILFPFFAPGQMASQVADFTIIQNGTQGSDYAGYNHSVIHLTFASDYQFAAEGNALIIMPFVGTAFLFGAGLLIKEK